MDDDECGDRSRQRSVPTTGVRPVTEDISDDDLYAAFVEFLGRFGVAREIEADVIRLDIADDMYPTGHEPGRPLLVSLSRPHLRRLAWADENVFDDTDLGVVPATTRHVEVGFDAFTFYLEEAFESGLDENAGIRPGTLLYDQSVDDLRYDDGSEP